MENADAKKEVGKYLQAVVGRYKNSKVIAGWVVGNEYGYLGLWSFRQEGYDPSTKKAFRSWLETQYSGSISQLNSIWGSSYSSFNDVQMPINFDKNSPSWADLIQFRKQSLGNFVAFSAKMAKEADPNHLITYSKVGLVCHE